MNTDAPVDLLLECLRHVATRYDRKVDSASLLSGLPVDPVQGVLPEMFPRVAARAGFKANFSKTDFDHLHSHTGPVIVLLQGNQVGVVFNPSSDTAEYFLLDTNSDLRPVDKALLQRQYMGYAFTLEQVQADQSVNHSADMDIASKRKKWFWLTLWRYRSYYLQMIPASLLVNMFALSMPFFVMIVYDKVVPNNAVETLWVLAIGVTLVYLFDLMIRLVRGALLERAGREMDYELAGVLYEQVLSLSMRSIPNSTSFLANRLKAYETLREFFVSAAMLALVDLPFSVLMIGVIFFVAGPIGWVLLLAMAIGLAINLSLQVPLSRAVKNATASSIERQTLMGESIANLESIKANNAEGYLQRKMNKYLGSAALSGVKSHWYSLVGNSATTSLISLTSVAVIVAGVYRVNAGLLSMGALIATVMLTSRCMAPLAMVSGLMTRLQQSRQSLESLTDVMQMEREVDHRREYLISESFMPDFSFNKVTLTYEGHQTAALDIDAIKFNANESVALLGRIGCGKSTLVKLMASVLTPTSGSLLIDGIDATQYNPSDLRSKIGYVPQDASLFNGTLRDNITLGDVTISDDRIMQIAVETGLAEYINHHPQGLNAEVGERGALLSGGQRRAVALVRCLVREYQVIILDEPTANLDPHTEQLVIQSLMKLKQQQGVNLIIATHKKGVLALVDRAVVLTNGKVTADGLPSTVIGQSAPTKKKKSMSKAQFKVSNSRGVAKA